MMPGALVNEVMEEICMTGETKFYNTIKIIPIINCCYVKKEDIDELSDKITKIEFTESSKESLV